MNLRPTITLWNYIIKEHIGPFIFAIAITTFILLMDKIFDLLDLIIGKGLDATVVAEVFLLSLPWIVALTVPMAVLISTLMAFGRMSEDNEIIAMKAGGVSIVRMLIPVLIFAGIITGALIYFNDNILPEANHRLRNLMIAINKKRPGLRIEEGLFIDEFEGYSVFVEEVDPVTSDLSDVTIYEYGQGRIPRLIKAERGELEFVERASTLVLRLYDGTLEEVDREDPRKFRRSEFYSHQINIQGFDSQLERSEREYRGDREMNIEMMRERIVELREKEKPIIEEYYDAVHQSAWFPLVEATTFFPRLKKYVEMPEGKAKRAYDIWERRRVKDRIAYLEQVKRRKQLQVASKEKQINRYRVEIQKKYSVPFACLVFVLVGVPLGIAARKGGVGMGAGVSLGFFVVYYIFLLGGERLADRGILPPFIAMWAANILLFIVGIYLIIHRTREATFIDWSRFQVLSPKYWFDKLQIWRRERKKQKALERAERGKLANVRFKFPMLLDVYITREFLKSFFFSSISFTVVFLIVDVFERLHRFLDGGVPLSTVLQYYIYKLPWIIGLVIPMGLLLACVFSLGNLGKNRELTVMKAAGISLYRILISPLLIGLLMSFVVMLISEMLVPFTNARMYYIYNVEIKHRQPPSAIVRQNIFYRGEFERMYYIKTFNPKRERMQDVLLSYPVSDSVYARIDADIVEWENDAWRFQRGVVRTFNQRTEEETAYPFSVATFDFLTEVPEDFTKKSDRPEEMNYFELREFIQKLRRSGEDVREYLVDLYLKISFPFASFIIVLFGAPLSANVRKSGGALGFGLSLLFAFIYIGFVETGRAIGHKGIVFGIEISPIVAAWMGNIVFGIAGLILLLRARK